MNRNKRKLFYNDNVYLRLKKSNNNNHELLRLPFQCYSNKKINRYVIIVINGCKFQNKVSLVVFLNSFNNKQNIKVSFQ